MTLATIGIGIRHADAIRGLENLAAFLETHPDLPLSKTGSAFDYRVYDGTDEENRAKVDWIADILGVTALDPTGAGGVYKAVRHFGGGVTYAATAVSSKVMDEHSAVMSYLGNIRPETAVAA
jgi:hypothetical protein